MKILKWILRTFLKLLIFTVTISFAIIKFVLLFILFFLTLGRIGSNMTKF
ncbi:hypothetical protein IC1_06008 [Bacillus cereus VD022]|uniref:Uncharacterized protein n=1 Tax=Bacillus cereus TIAC219 TaxID=718222 RepID=A0ABC9SPV8_BACCE|nr:hypothetical protein IC1_06008 [Bacillus cereus VD022]EOQ57537.1 hypothetical protein IAY_06478 [Bacillus cereus TIAC219]